MFKRTKVRVLASPKQELLETSTKPVVRQITGIKEVAVEGSFQEFLLGVVIDYNNKEYDFEWDRRLNKLAKLSGEDMDPVFWQIASETLKEFFKPLPVPEVKQELPKVEEIEKIIESVIDPTSIHLQMEDEDREITTNSIPLEEEGVDFSDDDIFENARRFLQESK